MIPTWHQPQFWRTFSPAVTFKQSLQFWYWEHSSMKAKLPTKSVQMTARNPTCRAIILLGKYTPDDSLTVRPIPMICIKLHLEFWENGGTFAFSPSKHVRADLCWFGDLILYYCRLFAFTIDIYVAGMSGTLNMRRFCLNSGLENTRRRGWKKAGGFNAAHSAKHNTVGWAAWYN